MFMAIPFGIFLKTLGFVLIVLLYVRWVWI